MSKRFGRNQKRKLKAEISNLQEYVQFFSHKLDKELSKPPVMADKEQFFVYENPPVDCSCPRYLVEDTVTTHLLHTLEHEQYRDYIDPRMLVLKYHLNDNTVAFKYSEEMLLRMDKDSLKHYITGHMAAMLVDSLRKKEK